LPPRLSLIVGVHLEQRIRALLSGLLVVFRRRQTPRLHVIMSCKVVAVSHSAANHSM
jgi:hypothetical protein